jgi:hypothetical protein
MALFSSKSAGLIVNDLKKSEFINSKGVGKSNNSSTPLIKRPSHKYFSSFPLEDESTDDGTDEEDTLEELSLKSEFVEDESSVEGDSSVVEESFVEDLSVDDVSSGIKSAGYKLTIQSKSS